uniref:DDE_Tnp_1_7 domain-containing protein n=1 Tax=Strongyloides venezuelensis TaxID=75913 RepID=A0A0K0G596_STRVS
MRNKCKFKEWVKGEGYGQKKSDMMSTLFTPVEIYLLLNMSFYDNDKEMRIIKGLQRTCGWKVTVTLINICNMAELYKRIQST